jgi:hypothetical protein
LDLFTSNRRQSRRKTIEAFREADVLLALQTIEVASSESTSDLRIVRKPPKEAPMSAAQQNARMSDAEFREKYTPFLDHFVALRTRLNVAFDLPPDGSMAHAVQAAVDASQGAEKVRGEDWENACHEVIWKADPALFERIEKQALDESRRRLSRFST